MAKAVVRCTEKTFDQEMRSSYEALTASDGVDLQATPGGERDANMESENNPFRNDHGHQGDYDRAEADDLSDDDDVDAGEVPNEQHQQAWNAVDRQQQVALVRLHANMGHRPPRILARALAIAGAPRDVIAAARALRCSTCDQLKRQKPQRPAHIPRARAFGDVVCADLLDMKVACGFTAWALNIVDAASGFQVCRGYRTRTLLKWFPRLRKAGWFGAAPQ